jgi:hypothetical protein
MGPIASVALYTTFIELLIRYSSYYRTGRKARTMSDLDKTQTTPSPTEDGGDKGHRGPSPSQVAAVVEAAYILEALRK